MKRLWDSIACNSAGGQKMQVLTDKVKFLDARASDVRKEVEHGEIQPGKKQRAEVNHWLNTVKEKMTEYENIKKEGQEKGFSSLLIGRIEEMTREVQELHKLGKFPDGLVLPDHERLPLLVTKPVGEMFHMNIEKIMGWLKNPQQFMFGIYGMGGVGKTTLLMRIHDQLLKDSTIIGNVYWVTVSQYCSMHKLQNDIAKVVGMDLSKEEDEKKRAAVLHDRLGKMGRMVFILDDMWEASYVEDIGIPLGESGCKVILTTRSWEVCRRMGCGNFIFEVKTLARNEARNLFIDQLMNYGELSPEVKQIVDLVADECGCLPLAIITIGRCMRAFTCVYEWKNALEELRNPSRRQSDMEDKVLLKLKFSYDRLRDKTLQDCFLSCVLYPEDFSVPREVLVDVWMMEGLLDFVGSREEQLCKGHSILNTLINSCLLEPHTQHGFKDGKCVKMHDLIREMAIFITRKHPRFISKPRLWLQKVPTEEQWTEELVKVSLFENKIKEIGPDMSPPPRCPKLSVLMLSKNPLERISESFFLHMTALTVLDLSFTSVKRLPESVSDLENLRAILLKGCDNLEYVPSLAKLTNLRVLDLPYGVEMEEVPRGMERLKCLEKISYCRWNQSEWTSFNKLVESWERSTLCCYDFELYGGSYIVSPFPALLLCDYYYDRKVSIEEANLGVKAVTPLLPRTIEMLSIIGCEIEGRRSLTDALPSLGGAKELKALEIFGCRGLEYVLSACNFYSQLDTLELLSLAYLPDVRGVIMLGEGGGPKFSHLKRLCIEDCPKIKVVFPFELLHQQNPLPNLQYMSVFDCEELEEIYEVPRSSSSNAINPNPIVVSLPNLRTMEFRNLPKLKSLYGGRLFLCPSLEELDIEDCPKLEEICDASPSILASIPTEKDDPHWWEPLRQHYPHEYNAHHLSDLVHTSQQLKENGTGCCRSRPID